MGVDSKDISIGFPFQGTDQSSEHADDIGAVHDRHAEREITLNNYHVAELMSGESAEGKHGHRLGRGPTGGGGEGSQAEDKKKKIDSLHRMALKQLEDQIARLTTEIRALKRELGEIDDMITAIQVGRELPDTEAAKDLKAEYKRQTGEEYDHNDPEAQALLLQIAQERREVVQDELNQKIRDRGEYQAELDSRTGEVGREIAQAPTEEALAQVVKDRPLADVATAVAQSGSDETTVKAHDALGSNLSQEHTVSENFETDAAAGSHDDTSWFDTPSQSASAASAIDGVTRINDGGNVQPTFARAVAGNAVPPGVDSPAQTAEHHEDADGIALTQESAPV